MGLFNFIRGKVPLGDNNLANALVKPQTYAAYSLLAYPQFLVRRPLRETPAANQLWINQSWTTAGYGGLVNGQVIFQSLGPNPNNG